MIQNFWELVDTCENNYIPEHNIARKDTKITVLGNKELKWAPYDIPGGGQCEPTKQLVLLDDGKYFSLAWEERYWHGGINSGMEIIDLIPIYIE